MIKIFLPYKKNNSIKAFLREKKIKLISRFLDKSEFVCLNSCHVIQFVDLNLNEYSFGFLNKKVHSMKWYQFYSLHGITEFPWKDAVIIFPSYK